MKRMAQRLALALIAGALIASGAQMPASAAPGNDGTVKVDGVDILKQSNANEPHVGCSFSIEWYGFDVGATSQVRFETQPPTGTRALLVDTGIPMGSNATPGGSPAALDQTRYYTLEFDPALDYEHPIQGFHVKLTVNTTGSIGADTKYKVFWVKGCEQPPPPPV